jgi:hypothetical protein
MLLWRSWGVVIALHKLELFVAVVGLAFRAAIHMYI